MMKQELEKMVGRTVTMDQFNMINDLYMMSDLNKQDFVKSIKKMINSIPEETHRQVMIMSVTDNSGHRKTPNGCYYHTVKVELVDVSIKTGKIKVKVIPNSYDLRYGFDLSDCQELVEVVEAA